MTSKAIKLSILIAFLIFVSLAYAFSAGPPTGATTAPGDFFGEEGCTECHDEFLLNSGRGILSLESSSSIYEFNQRINFTVSIRQKDRTRWGFQMTALDRNGRPAGQFVIADPLNTQLQIEARSGRQYVEHTQAGTHSGSTEGVAWKVDWIAPASNIGTIEFFVAGNAANGDGAPTGDFIYTKEIVLAPPSVPLVSITAPRTGEVIAAGQQFNITWTASKDAASFDVQFLPDGAGSLPIAIKENLPGSSRSFLWRAPAAPLTSRARINIISRDGEDNFAVTETGDFAVVRRGDLDKDGAVTVQDLITLIQILLGQGQSIAAADIDQDGSTNTQDLIRLIQALLGISPL